MKKTIEQQLQDVDDYFKSKVLSGDYEVIETNQHEAVLSVDDKYDFKVWIGNDMPDNIFIYGITAFKMPKLSDSEKQKAWDILEPKLKAYNETTVKAEKLKQYNKLKKELEL